MINVNFAPDETDALDNLNLDGAGTAPESVDALDEMFKTDETPAADPLEEAGQGTEQPSETEVPAETPPAEVVPEAEVPAGETPPAEVVPEAEVTPEEETVLTEEELLKEVEKITAELDKNNKEQEAVVENSKLTDPEKEELNGKLREKDDLIFELQTRYSSLEGKYKDSLTRDEDTKLNGLVNQKFIDKFESDPDVQTFVAFKSKADLGDEKAKARLETFYKDKLSELGYDLESLVAQKKLEEKKALAGGGSASDANIQLDDTIDTNDALDNLEV